MIDGGLMSLENIKSIHPKDSVFYIFLGFNKKIALATKFMYRILGAIRGLSALSRENWIRQSRSIESIPKANRIYLSNFLVKNNPKRRTLYPVPCTLYSVTLYPVLCNPVPCTLYPVLCNPVPCTLYSVTL